MNVDAIGCNVLQEKGLLIHNLFNNNIKKFKPLKITKMIIIIIQLCFRQSLFRRTTISSTNDNTIVQSINLEHLLLFLNFYFKHIKLA